MYRAILVAAGVILVSVAIGRGLGLLLRRAVGHRIASFLTSAALGMILLALLAVLVHMLPAWTFVGRSPFLKQLLVTVIVSVFIVAAWSPRVK